MEYIICFQEFTYKFKEVYNVTTVDFEFDDNEIIIYITGKYVNSRYRINYDAITGKEINRVYEILILFEEEYKQALLNYAIGRDE